MPAPARRSSLFPYTTLFRSRFRRADGVYRWHLSRALAMRDGEGRVLMWFGSNTDIDDQKRDRKSTRLNSSHANISYAVFCLKKKRTTWDTTTPRVASTASTL